MISLDLNGWIATAIRFSTKRSEQRVRPNVEWVTEVVCEVDVGNQTFMGISGAPQMALNEALVEALEALPNVRVDS